MIESEGENYPIQVQCRVMAGNRSVYYAYLHRKKQPKTGAARDQGKEVQGCFSLPRRRYGSRRIANELKIGRFRVRRLMKEQNGAAIQPKSDVPRTTDSRHGGRISPHLLKDNQIEVKQKGQARVGDITDLALRNGKFGYLATSQDKYTRRIVGWAIREDMTAELVVRAWQMGLRRRWRGKHANKRKVSLRGSKPSGWKAEYLKMWDKPAVKPSVTSKAITIASEDIRASAI